jgi:hypothetical protein
MKNSIIRWAAAAILLIGSIGGIAAQQNGEIPDSDMHVVSFEPLSYPAVAHSANIQGVVVVKATLDNHGRVVDAWAISGPKLLIRASVENAKRWQLQPNSQRAAVLVYDFRIEGVCHDNSDPSQFLLHPPNFATITACQLTPVP